VKQLGAGSGAEGVQLLSDSTLEAIRPQLRTHGWRLRRQSDHHHARRMVSEMPS
jgi:hypothetical protein